VLALASIFAVAITAGAPSSDAAVVALVRGDQIVCSGAVIAPRAILTAAHCASSGITEAATGDAVVGSPRVNVVAWLVDPDFDPSTLDHDVAIAIVDPPIGAAPLALAADPDGVAVGDVLTVIGYGATVAGDTTPPARRSGTSQVSALDAGSIATSAAPSQTCEGDSGGPALSAAGAIVGVASSGDTACTAGAHHARVAAHRVFIDGAVAATADAVAGPGDRCWYDANCAAGAGPCTPAADEPSWSFCAPACDAGAACPDGLACEGGACVHPAPSPGALGAACATDADCSGALCATPAGGGAAVCTDACFPDLPGFCPDGFACAAAADGSDACFPAPAHAGGCAAAGGGGGAILLIAFAALVRRPRR
jgi:hypothetical protein